VAFKMAVDEEPAKEEEVAEPALAAGAAEEHAKSEEDSDSAEPRQTGKAWLAGGASDLSDEENEELAAAASDPYLGDSENEESAVAASDAPDEDGLNAFIEQQHAVAKQALEAVAVAEEALDAAAAAEADKQAAAGSGTANPTKDCIR
jgi:hypothetical protein